jgi:hypothetical protein
LVAATFGDEIREPGDCRSALPFAIPPRSALRLVIGRLMIGDSALVV